AAPCLPSLHPSNPTGYPHAGDPNPSRTGHLLPHGMAGSGDGYGRYGGRYRGRFERRRCAMAEKLIAVLPDRSGRTYAEEAGIRLADRPAPLYQLLVLATLVSARSSGRVAVAAARELFRAGYRTPPAMSPAS